MKNQFALNAVLMLYNSLATKAGSIGLFNPQNYVVNVADSAYPLYLTYIMCCFAALSGVISYMTVAHKQYFYIFCYSLLLSVLIILGFEINGFCIIAFVIIFALIIFYNNARYLKLSYVYMAFSVVLVAIISFSVSYLIEPALKVCSSPYELIKESIDYNKGTADSYCDGKIAGHKFYKGDETALKINQSSPKPLYLKGFVGAEFNGSAWEEPDFDISYVERELFYILHKNNFINLYQQASFYFFINPDDEETKIEIEYVDADDSYIYVPYELKNIETVDFFEINGDYQKRIPSENKKYSMTISSTLYQKLLSLKEDNKDKLVGAFYENFALCENNYSDYVSKYYLNIPEADRRVIEDFFESSEKDIKELSEMDVEDKIDEIRSMINSVLEYDENTKISVFKRNVIDYIINDVKTGYDKHYATLGTLMLRAVGVPARYVEGYVITPEDAVKMKSDTLSVVKGSAAHAWTEIYVEGTGWMPVEIYEDDYNRMFPDINELIGKSSN